MSEPPVAALQEIRGSGQISSQAGALAIKILGGEGSLTDAVEAVGNLLVSYPDVDGVTAALTNLRPSGDSRWIHLGERAWLREWNRPGTTCTTAPRAGDDGAERVVSMPWLSQRARRDVIAVVDSALLPPEASKDKQELDACRVKALVSRSIVCDGSLFGALALARETPGAWPEPYISDLRLLSAALGSRMSSTQSNQALADAIKRGDLARASQQEFFSAIGHELRTPIAAILGTAEMLATDARDLVASTQPVDVVTFASGAARDADVVLSAGEQLIAVVDDLLNTGQELGGGTESQWVDVAEAVGDVVHWLRAPALSASVSVTAVVPPALCVLTTSSGLRQILTNLVGNAIAYNTPGGTVEVTTSRVRDEFGEHRVRISVRDTGPGLSLEQQRDVFKPFVRFAGPETKGTGLGLSLSRSLAERDGGMMGLESEPGEGSVFWVDLPAAEAVPRT